MTITINHSDINDPFARQRLIEWWDQDKLANAQLLVVGAGALGNEVLKNLALVGVGQIYIIDFDTVEPSNLSRSVLFRSGDSGERHKAEVAAERIAQLHPSPQAQIAYFHGDLVWDLGAGVYRAMTAVLGCLDNIEARRCVNMYSWKAQTTWIDGAINKLSGSVGVFSAAAELACYECGVDDALIKLSNERYSCMGGVVRSKIRSGHEPTTQTTSAIVAAIQSQEAIKICHGMAIPAGRKIYYNGLLHNFDADDPSLMTVTDLSTNPMCFCHQEDRFDNVVVAQLTNASTAGDILGFARENFGMANPELRLGTFHPSALGRRFIVDAQCPTCNFHVSIERAAHRVQDHDVICPTCPFTCTHCGFISYNEASCPECEAIDRPSMNINDIHTIAQDSPYSGYTLATLGIPNLDIIKVTDGFHEQFVQIGDDLSLVFTKISV